MTSPAIVSLIDHAVLHPTQTAEVVRLACQLCAKVQTASICVKPCDVLLAAELLQDSSVLVSTVIGFPHGGATTTAKVSEAVLACQQGARELDMVINLGWAFMGNWRSLQDEIAAVVQAGREANALTKVILETGLLPSDELKRQLCHISAQAGAAFVKTSTGFGMVKDAEGHLLATGATEHDVRLMRAACGPEVQVKASGGIRTLADAERMIAAGATRLGTSATAALAAAAHNEAARQSASPADRPAQDSHHSPY